MLKRVSVVTVGVLTALCLSGCGDESEMPSASKAPAAATTIAATRTTFVAAKYCKMYKRLEDQLDGDPYDAQMYAAAIHTMSRAADSGPPELADEWAVVIEAFKTVEAAAAEADVAGFSEVTLYLIFRARAEGGPWPRGVDRQAIEEMDQAIAAIDDEAVNRADDAIAAAARRTCDTDD